MMAAAILTDAMPRIFKFILANPALALAIGVSAMMAIGLSGVWIYTGSIGNDFGVYWRTANLPLQWAYWHGFEYPFPYMPTALLWIAPLKLTPQWLAFILWAAVGIFMLIRTCRPYLTRPELWLLFASPPLMNGLMTGQVSAVMAALMIFGCGTKNRYAAGIAFGIIASVKPQMVIMVPFFLLLLRDWKAFGAAAATFAMLVAISVSIFGLGAWSDWLASLPEFRFRLIIMDIVGVSPAAVADHHGLNPIPFMLFGGAVGAWLVYRCRTLGPVEVAAALAVGSLLAAPYALNYDLAVVMPFLVQSIFRGQITAAVAISGAYPPVPLAIAAFNLARKSKSNIIAAVNHGRYLGRAN